MTSLYLTIAEVQAIARRSPTRTQPVVRSLRRDQPSSGWRMMDAYHPMATLREHVTVFYDAEAATKRLGLDFAAYRIFPGARSDETKLVEGARTEDSDKSA